MEHSTVNLLKNQHHVHLSFEDCVFRQNFNVLTSTEEERQQVVEISNKMHDCNVCRIIFQNHRIFVNELAKVVATEKVETTEKIFGWLDSLKSESRNLLDNISAALAPSGELQAVYGVSRGSNSGTSYARSENDHKNQSEDFDCNAAFGIKSDNTNANIELEKIDGIEGVYELTLSKAATFSIEIKGEGIVSAVIRNIDAESSTENTMVNVLRTGERRITEDITLSKGSYGLCFIERETN
jgi:hypothetical protein